MNLRLVNIRRTSVRTADLGHGLIEAEGLDHSSRAATPPERIARRSLALSGHSWRAGSNSVDGTLIVAHLLIRSAKISVDKRLVLWMRRTGMLLSIASVTSSETPARRPSYFCPHVSAHPVLNHLPRSDPGPWRNPKGGLFVALAGPYIQGEGRWLRLVPGALPPGYYG